MTLLRWLTFLLSQSCSFGFFSFLLTLLFVPQWLSALWGILIIFLSVSIELSSNSKQDAPFHWVVYDYSRADWDFLRDH